MTPRTLLLTAFALSLTGCQPLFQKPPSPKPPATAPTTEPIATTDPTNGSADALARKAADYERMVDAIRARAASRPAIDLNTAKIQNPDHSNSGNLNDAKVNPNRPIPGALTHVTESVAKPAPSSQPTPVISELPTPEVIKPIVVVHAPATLPAPDPVISAERTHDSLSQRIQSTAKNAPRDLSATFDLQLLRFLQEQQSPDLTALANLPGDDREALSAVIDGLSNFRAALRSDPTAMLSKKVRPLVEMADRLRAQSDLEIPTVVLCSTIRGFGNYEPRTTPLVEGRENRVYLYSEITGFASRPSDNQSWETRLTQDLILYRNETEVWRKPKPASVTDRCRNKRHDFYTVDTLLLPATLPAGTYTLKVSIIDQVANRVAETTTPLTLLPAGSFEANK